MSLQLSGLLDVLRQTQSYKDLVDQLRESETQVDYNVVRSARPFLLAALAQDWPAPILYLTAAVRRAYNVSEQLPVWLDEPQRLHRFAEPSALFYDRAPWDLSVIRNRIATLSALSHSAADSGPIIVTSARALLQKTLPPDEFHGATVELARGERHAMEQLILCWIGMGYEPAALVMEPGSFSRRGGILDVFPLSSEFPLRIEFFDDEIESLRRFDPASQRSIDRVETARIVPAREALPLRTARVGAQLQTWAKTTASDPADYSSISADIESLSQGSAFPCLEHYLPYLYETPASLLDYLPDSTLILIEDPYFLEETALEIAEQAEVNRGEAESAGQVAPEHPLPYLPWETLQQALDCRSSAALSSFSAAAAFEPGERLGGQLRLLLTQVRRQLNQGDRVVVITEQVERLENLWYEQDASTFIPTVTSIDSPPEPGSLCFIRGAAAEGWSLKSARGTLHFVTDAEIFGWTRPEPRRRHEPSGGRGGKGADTSYTDWQEGTYVVHVDYGIGKFMGLRHRTVNTTEREYLLVEYQGADTIYVPIHQADRLSRYVGADDKTPKLNQLGKADQWIKARDRARRNAVEEARELLAIYSKRAKALGHAFSGDTAWQHEMEAGFPFVETEDQLRVIQEVKADMHDRKPMDRLICGDVGFGKTEVALRAAFKAVQDGLQVAVLVPTTVLAQQHYEIFCTRLAAFPVEIEMMSRFRNKAQQTRIAERITSGEADIIVGTHRLLSKDIRFKRLGLMIIDEEQRFGVKQKEHFKKLRSRIDILTLTATPIPRTLYLSLSGYAISA